ncbi:EamA family transporter RarD [Macrococcus equipercicus]|uniref:EamA family transporter RarD n=2 Tax=Macrococcus equipercicus TaxID=69967 RepID=A0A9Q9BNJ6_9STAP|nr:EamA family transporter RarD [Macrococcus equipercicus]UTH14823.1 EamA family transporter RarD [Macrococcus equipercicus]
MMSEQQKGIIFAATSYLLWGILPFYWRLIGGIGAYEILAHRIIWSFVFMVILIVALGKTTALKVQTLQLLTNKKTAISLFVAGVVIAFNWGLFIWAVANHHVLQASLGYYINPLMSILLGMIFMKERFSRVEWTAIILAALGVLYMALSIGEIPYISLLLAVSFALYGLIKKNVKMDAMFTILLECLATLPFALAGIWYLKAVGMSSFGYNKDSGILLFSGILTAIPLILFTAGARRIPLSLIGFLQYIAPTLMFIQGVFLYNEAFSMTHLVTFACIWLGLIIYSCAKYQQYRTQRRLSA